MSLASVKDRVTRSGVLSTQESIPSARTEYYGIAPDGAGADLEATVIGPFRSINSLESYLNNPANECVAGVWTVTTKVKKVTKLRVVERIH